MSFLLKAVYSLTVNGNSSLMFLKPFITTSASTYDCQPNTYTKLKEESHNPLAEKVVIRTEGHTSYKVSIHLRL